MAAARHRVSGTEVIRQYDGWADWPDDTRNLLAVANAFAGMFSIHTNYRNVDLNDPNNVRFTPDVAGQPGNVTYVWVPTKTLHWSPGPDRWPPALDKKAATDHRGGLPPTGRHSRSGRALVSRGPAVSIRCCAGQGSIDETRQSRFRQRQVDKPAHIERLDSVVGSPTVTPR